METRRRSVLAASMLLLAGCGSGPDPGTSDTGSPTQPAGSVSPSARAVSGCPAGLATQQPGLPDQARPDLGVMSVLAAMDTTAGRIVAGAQEFVNGAGVSTLSTTWAFDVRTNTWVDQGPADTGAAAPVGVLELVYDETADRTVGLPTGLAPLWTYDLAGNTWTQVDAEGGGSDWWPIVAYDPDRQQVLAWEHHGLHGAMVKALDLKTGTWQVLHAQDQASGAAPPGADALIMGQVVAAYDTLVHRLILIVTNAGDLEQTGETWAFDPAEGTWEQGAPVPNTLPGGYPAGWAAAFDPQQGRTVLFADTAVLAYDAAANAWTTIERGPGWPTGCTVAGVAVDPTARVGHQMVYDPITGRMIVLGGSVRPVGEAPGGLSDEEAPAVDDVWAYHLASNTWTQLLAPSATVPQAQATSRLGP
jgi:hypothetical protein